MFVGEDQAAKVKGGYSYKAQYKYFENGKSIVIKKNNKQETIDNFLSALFYSYTNKDLKLMKSLFDEAGRKKLNSLSSEKIKKQFEAVGNLKNPKLEYVLKYKKGFIVSWYDESFLGKRKIYITKQGKKYKVSPIHHDKDEHFPINMNTFILKSPFEVYEPKLDKSFSNIKNNEIKELSFKLKKKGNFIHIFKKEEASKKVRLLLIDNALFKDNPLADVSEKDAYIEVKLKGENFKDIGKQDLYYLESTYPMSYIPKKHLKKARKLTIIKG